MQDAILQAAECLRQGNHAGAEEWMSKLQKDCTVDSVLTVLQTSTQTANAQYTHFVGLKVLKYSLIQSRTQWLSRKAGTLQFLMDYCYSLGDIVMQHTWKPVVAELAATVAIVLKLGCISESGLPVEADIHSTVHYIISLLRSFPTPAAVVVHRRICHRTVEEFGLFDASSRYRGLTISVHRQCRVMFESGDLLPTLVQSAFSSVLLSPSETAETADAALECLVACMSWSSHRFFEEETSENEVCDAFSVSGSAWDALLLRGVVDPASGSHVSLFSMLSSWYSTTSIKTAPINTRHVAEISQLLCSFKGSGWDNDVAKEFLMPCFSLCINIFESISGSSTAGGEHSMLPILSNSMLRLVTNYTDLFLLDGMQPLLEKYSAMTQYLVARDAEGDDEDFMSSLDDALSGWFHLASHVGRHCSDYTQHTAGKTALRQCCSGILSFFLSCKTAACVVSDDSGGLADIFTTSHVNLLAHVGRTTPAESAAVLQSTLHQVVASANNTSTMTEESMDRVCEGIWLALKVIQYFIADPPEGEQPYIPQCFMDSAESSEAVVRLMECVCAASQYLFEHNVNSPAVYAALTDVVYAYVRNYVEAEESPVTLSQAFNEGASIVAYCVSLGTELLRRFPYDSDVMSVVCNALDAVAEKSTNVHAYVASSTEYATITAYVRQTDRFKFVGRTRGRLAAFLLSCNPQHEAVLGTVVVPLLSSKPDAMPLEESLEAVNTLAGLCESLKRPDIICTSFLQIVSVTQQLLASAFSKFHDREIIISSVQCVHTILTTCAPFLEDASILLLLQLVENTLVNASCALRTVGTWHSADGEADRVSLLKSIAKLISAISLWKSLDCFLPDADTASLSCTTVQTLAHLLDMLDARSLCFPDLEDACFSALEMCADSFTQAFVASSQSASFLSATLYSLASDRVNIQRIGIAVATQVATFEESNRSADGLICREFLAVILSSLVSGKVTLQNTHLVSKAIISLSSGVPSSMVGEIFIGVAEKHPAGRSFLEGLYHQLLSGLSDSLKSPTFRQQFVECLQNNLSLMRGVSVS